MKRPRTKERLIVHPASVKDVAGSVRRIRAMATRGGLERIPVQHTSRTDRTYYLHVKTTATGKPSYFFSTDAAGSLADKKSRAFMVDRFCFRGSVDDWIPIAGRDTLAAHVRKFVKHLGQESFYELY